MRGPGLIRHGASIVATAIVVASVAANASAAEPRQARTCITTIETDKGSMKVLRKIGPKQTCPPGEALYTWDRTGSTLLTGATGKRIATGDGAQYSGPGTGVLSSAKEAAWIPMPAGTLRNLNVRTELLLGSGATIEVRVVIGEFETELGCTVVDSNFCTAAAPITVGGGDVVSVKIVETGSSFPAYVSYSLEFAPPVPQ